MEEALEEEILGVAVAATAAIGTLETELTTLIMNEISTLESEQMTAIETAVSTAIMTSESTTTGLIMTLETELSNEIAMLDTAY